MRLRKLKGATSARRAATAAADKGAAGAAEPCPAADNESETTKLRFLAPIISNTKDLFYAWDREKRFVFANRTLENLWGLERDGFKGKTHTELGYPHELSETVGKRIELVFATKAPVTGEAGYIGPGGDPLYWEYTFSPVIGCAGDVELVAGVSREITERKRAEAALQESEEKYRQLFNSIDQGFFLIDVIFDADDRPVDMYFAEANAAAISLLGRDFTGKRLRELNPGYEEYWYEIFGQVARTGESVRMERYAEPDGMWVDFFAFKVGGPESRRIGSIFMDITPRKAMERELAQYRDNLERLVEERTAELRRSDRHYRTLVENAPLRFAILDRASRYVYRTRRPHEDGGNTDDKTIGKAWWDLGIPETMWRPWQDNFDKVLATRRKLEFETRYPDEKGELRDLIVHVVPEIDEQGEVEAFLCFTLDITERKRMEAELLRLDRLNTVGEMAAAIGHEVRNPLTTVRGYLQMLLRKEASAGYHEQFKTMIEELDRANGIISEFLSLAKNKAVELKRYGLNDVISTLLPLLQSEAYRTGHDIEVEMGDIPDTEMDEKEIRQLLLNLARNAFEAMRPGGRLTVRTGEENGRVVLAVGDTGRGIPPEVLAKLGTPFLTTKESGTGLGLAVCYRIAERHGAKIEVTTSPQGTTFVVRFKV